MIQRSGFYLLLILSIIFTACKKEDIVGSDYKPLGTSARDLLTSSTYSLLKIEISYMPGFKPDQQNIDDLVTFLKIHLDKPAGIQVNTREVKASGKTALSLKEIVKLEKTYRSIFTEYNEIGVHILITDSDYSDPNNFATSYWNTSACLFGKTINENSGGAGQTDRTVLISTLLLHEFGHLLGLVNQGSPMQSFHKDSANGAHCNNSSCLMYYDVETPIGRNSYSSPALDANCIADLKAIRAK
jgi:hypothetical protein